MSEPVPYEPVPADLIRVGDAERQQAATALGDHFAAGRLDQPEFDTRVQAAYAARTRVELRELFHDLPDPAPFRPEPAPGFAAGRSARDRRPRARRAGLPVFPLLPILAIFVGVSLAAGFPVFPLLFVLLFFTWGPGAWGRRGWR